MIYVDTKTRSAYENFGIEYYLATENVQADIVFLLWRTEPTLMLGKYQVVQSEINSEYAKEHGIKLVRRMSGGGTIFTDLGGFQYTFITRDGAGVINLAEYIAPVVTALCKLGVPAEMNGRNDITVRGKKVSGNAQYKIGDVTVHHGSLLFCTDIEMLVRSVSPSDEKIVSKGIKSVRERVANISDFLPSSYTADEFASYLIAQMSNGGENTYILTEYDRMRAKEIANARFENHESIFGASPKYAITREKRFAGGTICVSFEVYHDRITHMSIAGDVFSSVELEKVAEALVGVKADEVSIMHTLDSMLSVGDIMGVTNAEITTLIVG